MLSYDIKASCESTKFDTVIDIWNMAYESGFASAGEIKLHYLKIGTGPKLLIAFHGYGNEASLFRPLEKYLSSVYTIYSIDLPYHGKSSAENVTLLKKDLVQLVNTLCEEMNVTQASLAGYSMGGRLCISIVERIPQQVDKVLLIASDGLVFDPFYFFLTNTWVGRKLFSDVLTSPQKYIRFTDWLKQKKIIQSHHHSHALYYLQLDHNRSFLLKVWPGLRKIIPSLRKVRAAIHKHSIPVYIFMGTQDKLIPYKRAHSFKKDLKSVHLYFVEKGHRVMDHDTLPQISACLLP